MLLSNTDHDSLDEHFDMIDEEIAKEGRKLREQEGGKNNEEN